MTEITPHVVFLIANDRHHIGAALPVIEELRKDGFGSCSVLSMCEFRGFDSPASRLRNLGVPLQEIVPFRLRTPSTGRTMAKSGGSARSLLRSLLWHALLSPSLIECLAPKPDFAVLPNDGAYPYDRICRLLQSLRIPYLILQEGVRFARPSESLEGRSTAAAWAVWGETSARYFRDQGAAPDKVHVTGSPRFDELLTRDWSPAATALRNELAHGKPFVALLSNPIDDLGLVSGTEKLELVRKLAVAACPQLVARGWHLVIKLHGRESPSEFRRALASLPPDAPISIVSDCPLYPLLKAARGALTFASSVGLEALLCEVPLAVVEIPGHGFVHDFVSSGVATGISWSRPVEEQLATWLAGGETRKVAAEIYLGKSVAHPGRSALRVADLIRRHVSRLPDDPG